MTHLNMIMGIDHVIRIDPAGKIIEPTGVHAPNLHDGELDDRSWTLIDGYSGQYRYSGPIMHESESIGGRMADDIMANPGLYVAIVDYPSDGGEPEGWAVAFKEVKPEYARLLSEGKL